MSSTKNETAPGPAEGSRRIAALRSAMGLTQEELAGRLSVSRIAVVNWESGKSQPAAQNYIEIAKLAKEVEPSSAVWFWKQAGIDDAALRSLLPEFKKAFAQAQHRLQAMLSRPLEGIVRLPLLRSIAHLDAPLLAPAEQIERWVPVPAFLVLNPETTSCVRPPVEASSLGGEDIWLLDSSEKDINRLRGHMVLAYDEHLLWGFLQALSIGTQWVPILTRERTLEDFAALGRGTFGVEFEPAQSKGQGQKVKRAIVSDLAARILSGHATPLVPERPWRILGCVVGLISSVQGRHEAELAGAPTRASIASPKLAAGKLRRGAK